MAPDLFLLAALFTQTAAVLSLRCSSYRICLHLQLLTFRCLKPRTLPRQDQLPSTRFRPAASKRQQTTNVASLSLHWRASCRHQHDHSSCRLCQVPKSQALMIVYLRHAYDCPQTYSSSCSGTVAQSVRTEKSILPFQLCRASP